MTFIHKQPDLARSALKIKDTTESDTSPLYLDLLLQIEREEDFITCDERDDFNFHIKTFRSSTFARQWRFNFTAYMICSGLLPI